MDSPEQRRAAQHHAAQHHAAQHLVIMGVSGSGKTTLALILRDRLSWPYAEADEFHPQANLDKMSAGVALTDEDRWPWLEAMRQWMTDQAQAGHSTLTTCSALRLSYRDVLRRADGQVKFVHLAAAAEVIGERLAQRIGHFMPATLLPSQLATLEPLTADEDGLTLVADVPPQEVADRVVDALGLVADRP